MKKRIAQLEQRLEKLIALNQEHRYEGVKLKQYLDLLTAIKLEKTSIWLFKRANNSNYSEALETAKNTNIKYLKSITLTKTDLFNLTAPNFN